MRRTAVAIAVLVLAAAAFVLLRPRERPRNVILVSIDTLRQDRVGAYGYERPTTPSLDALAARGVVFENATSPSAWTVPSHASLFTGLYPRSHGVTGDRARLGASLVPMAAWLREQGYDTGAIVNVVLLDRSRGFARGFDHFELLPLAEDSPPAAAEIHARALRWLDQPRERPFFLFLHHYDVHSDYRPGPEYRRMLVRPYEGSATGTTAQLKAARLGALALGPDDARHLSDLYDAEIRQLDDELGRFFRELERRGLLDETALLVTSDHGEEFLEHGSVLHGRTLHGELVRVPLVLAGPGIPRGRRVAAPASLVDVLPTVAGLLGLEPPPSLDGVDLSPSLGRLALAARAGERPLFFEADLWLGRREGDFRRAVQRGRWKLHYARLADAFALYDLDLDPGERADLAAREPARVAELRALLAPFVAAGIGPRPSPDVGSEDLEQLRALGYVE